MAFSIQHGTWQLFVRTLKATGLRLPGLRVAELGCQTISPTVFGHEFDAKQLFERFGATHVSFDWNGRRGALKHDLGMPLPSHFREQFDLVTNCGTAEHVETSQYWCWRNTHELCRVGGYMMHAGPEWESWPKHCRIWYTLEWFRGLAAANGYDVLFIDRWNGNPGWSMVRGLFRKSHRPFVDEETFDGIAGMHRR